jgi:uncharacterized membrane protein
VASAGREIPPVERTRSQRFSTPVAPIGRSTTTAPIASGTVYEDFISDVVRVVEAVGAAIMVLGAVIALVAAAVAISRPDTRSGAYTDLRRNLGRAILLGLEVLIIGDIVRTIVVDPTIESVVVLGLIVVIRIVLSFSLEIEIDGTTPWSRWRLRSGRS